MATALPLDRVTSLALDPGAQVVVRGLVTTSVDGSSFDVATTWDGRASHSGGLFDLAAGGLRVAEQDADRHEYVLAATADPGPACAAAGVESPCLVPRLATLAHDRLKTQAELASTLSGRVELEGTLAPAAGALPSGAENVLTAAGLVLGLVLGAALVFGHLRRRARSAIGRVRAAGREALRATQGDVTLERVRGEVRSMLARASELEAARRACARRLRRIDRAALERKREASPRSNGHVPDAISASDASEALAWITAECAESARLESDHASSLLGLQRIESALRVIALRAREHRGTSARIALGDPVDAAALELELRDASLREADRATAP